jgi:hypothetical protein
MTDFVRQLWTWIVLLWNGKPRPQPETLEQPDSVEAPAPSKFAEGWTAAAAPLPSGLAKGMRAEEVEEPEPEPEPRQRRSFRRPEQDEEPPEPPKRTSAPREQMRKPSAPRSPERPFRTRPLTR